MIPKRQRIQAVLDKAKQKVEADHIARQANRLCTHAASVVRERAMDSTEFEAKLKALKAEFEDAQKMFLTKYLETELQEDCGGGKTEWHPRAIELAQERADECLAPAIRSFLSHGSDSSIVKMEDVFPAETAKEESEKVA